MANASGTKYIGILTSGGDCPGLNAAIRGVAKAASGAYGMDVVGILDGFTGLVENRVIRLIDSEMTGLLTMGGTILGSSRNKPNKMPLPGGASRDMTGAAVETYQRLGLDCLVCLGGDGTAKNALHLKKAGLNVITLPKTIDNDVVETDVSFGFDSAMAIATEALDRLHTTASSHARIMLVDIMGNKAGWLALSASLAGGADVCLIPEIPFRFESIVNAIEDRQRRSRRFSLISVAEGAFAAAPEVKKRSGREASKKASTVPGKGGSVPILGSAALAKALEARVGLEARVTTLGYVQRGGIPTPADRLLATQLGTAAAKLIAEGTYGVMVAIKGHEAVPVPLEKVAGRRKTVPLDHPMIQTARLIGLCLGD